MAIQQHSGLAPAHAHLSQIGTQNGTDSPDAVFSAVDCSGKRIADWLPVDVAAALSDPRNRSRFQLAPAQCSSMDRRAALTAGIAFPHLSPRGRYGMTHPGDLLEVETPVRSIVSGRTLLAVRLEDGLLTLVDCREVETGTVVRAGLPFSQRRIELHDGATGTVLQSHELLVLGVLVSQRKPNPSPAPYGGCAAPVKAMVKGGAHDFYEAVRVLDGSMEYDRPMGGWVVFDDDVVLQSGSDVVVEIGHRRRRPKPAWWKRRELAAWKDRPWEWDQARCGYAVRRYSSRGSTVLLLAMGGEEDEFPSWEDGEVDADGFETYVTFLGTVVESETIMAGPDCVFAVLKPLRHP